MNNNTLKALFVLLFSLIYAFANGQTAGFTADVTSGCAPLVVHFHNTSTGGTTYTWNLGNGTTSGLTDVSGSYLTPGTYTVTLTVSNGTTTSTHTMTITVYPSPTVSFYALDTAVCPGTPVTFISTTIAGVAGALTYIWNFGDGSTSTATSPSHVFPGPGYYNITLFATNAQGCQSSHTIGSYIHVYTAPVANFSAATTYFCNPPGDATFTSTVTGTPGYTYAWSFGDGGTSGSANPTYNYGAPGNYSVGLIVTDGHGCKDTVNRFNYIHVEQLVANFTSVPSACVNSWVMFHNTSSAFGSCVWSFGDGGASYLDSPSHFFTIPGTYTVTLVITSGPCHDTITHTIVINPGPIIGITPSPLHPCPAPVSVTFTGGGVPAGSTVDWYFGDAGSTGTGNPASHTYGNMGIYDITMIVIEPNGCRDTIDRKDTIYNLIPIVIDTPNSGCVPLTVPFYLLLKTTFPDSLLHPYPYGVSSYTWHFGDGSPVSTSPTPSHTYTATGVYTGYVTFTTSNGCTETDSFTIAVGVPPVASFYGLPTHICADRSVTFISTSTGIITNYYWDFGDGGTANDSLPTTTHTYTYPGTYTVTLIVYDNGCPSLPFTLTNYIIVDSPKAFFVDTFACIPPTSVTFTNSSIGANTWLWLFGDGTTSTLLNPTHSFPSLGTYVVDLTTFNILSGCRDTMQVVINLAHPVPNFTADDTAICKGNLIHFTPTVTGGTASQYYWYIDSLPMMYIPGVYYNDTFYKTGLYTIRLVIMDQHGCFDTVTKNNYVIVAKPIDSFFAAPPNGCWPLIVTFTDSSRDVPGTFMVNYNWTFGDGATVSVTTNPTAHTYTAAGTYGVKEIVTDNIGCKDTLTKPSLISVTRPHAVFTANKLYPCAGDSVTFTNLSLGIISSFWIFGDGGTATTNNATHAYMLAGAYSVKLVVTDINGCTDTANYINYIHVTKPIASFYMDDSFAICVPLSVHFFNTSTGAVTYHWSFGNGDSSIINSPNELYMANGLDIVYLIAINAYGCKDTAVGHVNLYGYAGGFSYTPDTGCTPLAVHFNAGLINVPSIIWDFADGITSTVSSFDTTTHVYIVPGKYVPKLILSDNTGCQNSSMGIDTIKVDAVYPGFTTFPHPICEGQVINFKDTSHSFFSTITTWFWTINGVDTSSLSYPPFTFNTVGNFPVTLTVTDGWGCIGSVSGTVNVLPPPVITVSPDTTVCVGDAATLKAFGGISYTWSPAATLNCTFCNPTYATPTVATQYTVTGTDSHGCIGNDTVSVFLKIKTKTSAWGSGEICRGDSLQLYDSGATKYNWIPNVGLNHTNIADPIASPVMTTTYEVIGQVGNCIPDTTYVTVTVHALPTVYAGLDQTILDGSSTTIKAIGTGINTLYWSPSQTLSCDSCYNPKATPLSTTTYSVFVTSLFGCKASDSVIIHVICDASQVFIPNTFTPNGDGNNDVFYPRGSGISIVKSFRVYNRWGELLFERSNFQINDENNAWNGAYKGGTPRADVYVYVVDAICENGEPINLKGDVTIIR